MGVELFPILCAPKWKGRKACVSRPLLEDDEYGSIPWLTFATAIKKGEIDYLLKKVAEKQGWSDSKVERAALKTLVKRERAAGWKPRKVDWGKAGSKILVRQGDELTASDILRAKVIKKAKDYLKAGDLVVAIPIRTMLIACDAKLVHGLRKFVDERIEGADRPITPAVFTTDDEGNITGIFSGDGEASDDSDVEFVNRIRKEHVAEEPKEPTGSWNTVRPKIMKMGGRGTLVMDIQCKGIETAEEAVTTEFVNIGPKLAGFDGFDGHVLFRFLPTAVKPTMINRRRLTELARELTGKAKEKDLGAGMRIRVTCRIDEGSDAGD